MPVSEAFQILDVVREQQINRNRARELVLTFLFGQEQLPVLAATKRQRLIHLLKHVLGEKTWSSVKRFLASVTPEGDAFLQKEVLRYARNGEATLVREVLCFLAGVPFSTDNAYLMKRVAARQDIAGGEGLPRETLLGLRGTYHKQVSLGKVRSLSAATAQSVHNDGALTALYKEVLAGLSVERHSGELKAVVSMSVSSLPSVDARIAIVLDLSHSMISSGERVYHPAALSLAIARLLRECVRNGQLCQVGGSVDVSVAEFPVPVGATDIASALISAARFQPQVIIIITDGYENVQSGDTELVVRGLRSLGLDMPIYQIAPLFTSAEDLSQRQLGESIEVFGVVHEDGVREIIARILLASGADTLSPKEVEQLQQLLFMR
jgi:hypothetical protein